MGFDLKSETGDKIQFTEVYWNLMLEIAKHFGWEAIGTDSPQSVSREDWDGSYDSNDGQEVSLRDASALANAVKLALESNKLENISNIIYSDQIKEAKRKADELMKLFGMGNKTQGLFYKLKNLFIKTDEEFSSVENEEISLPISEVSGALQELFEFCVRGSFKIW